MDLPDRFLPALSVWSFVIWRRAKVGEGCTALRFPVRSSFQCGTSYSGSHFDAHVVILYALEEGEEEETC